MDGLAILVEIDPHFGEVIEIAIKPEAGTGTFEGLGLRTRHGIVVVRPHLAAAAVRSKSVNRSPHR
jgi:hypothetical protein